MKDRAAEEIESMNGLMGDFVDSIVEGRQPSCSGYDGRASTEGAMAVIKSHETGLPVQLPLS